jgi:hypothetical protein
VLLAEWFGTKAMALPDIGARSSVCRKSGPSAVVAAQHLGYAPDGTRGTHIVRPLLSEGGSTG